MIMNSKIQFLNLRILNLKALPLFDSGISIGFPSPVDDFKESRIWLDKELMAITKLLFTLVFQVIIWKA